MAVYSSIPMSQMPISINYANVVFMNGQACVPVPPQPFLVPMPMPASIPKFRADLRRLQVFSVDPIGCKDIDDVIHCRVLSNGNFEVGVHVADVTEFISPGTLVDNEALKTGKSIKMIDSNVAHMCSIHPGRDKLTFSVIWEMTPDSDIISSQYVKSVVSSRAAFSYNQVQEMIDNNSLIHPLRNLYNLSKCMRKKRIERGALVLLEEKHKMKEAKLMVEELMIAANISVAEKIYKHFPQFSVLRRLPKYMGRAEYVVSRNMNPTDLCHHGIGSALYTHFTSPIRRYADTLVHRLLAASLGKNQIPDMFINGSNLLDNIIEKLNCPATPSIKTTRKSRECSTDATQDSVESHHIGDLCKLFELL